MPSKLSFSTLPRHSRSRPPPASLTAVGASNNHALISNSAFGNPGQDDSMCPLNMTFVTIFEGRCDFSATCALCSACAICVRHPRPLQPRRNPQYVQLFVIRMPSILDGNSLTSHLASHQHIPRIVDHKPSVGSGKILLESLELAANILSGQRDSDP